MWREKKIYFIKHDIYFTELMFILKNINLELKSALRTKYLFYQSLLYQYLSHKNYKDLGTDAHCTVAPLDNAHSTTITS